jgi:RimJ/RimL family protein N-acetyltransferase
VIEDGDLRLRRAEPCDLDFIAGLIADEEIEPFLAAVSKLDREALLEEIERSLAEPDDFGRFVVELREAGDWRPVGIVGFELRNRDSRIAFLRRLAVDPAFQRRGLGDRVARLLQHHLIFELDYHRLELEVYGFNERAIEHAEHAGFVREGRKRRAYLRDGEWVDSVLFAVTREDLEP